MGLETSDSKIFALCGILAVLVMSADVILGAFLDPSWDFSSVICDLGVSDNNLIATSFLVSCCVSGILFIISSVMWLSKESKLLKMTGVFIILSGVALMGVGLVDKTTDALHQVVVSIYALLFVVAIMFACIKDIMERNWTFVIGFAILAVYSVVSFFGTFPYLLTQFLLMGYVFLWYLLKCLGELDEVSESYGETTTLQ